MPKRKKKPTWRKPGAFCLTHGKVRGRFKALLHVPFHLECCDCGLNHVVEIQEIDHKRGTVTIGIWRDEDATEHSREGLSEAQAKGLGALGMSMLGRLSRKGK